MFNFSSSRKYRTYLMAAVLAVSLGACAPMQPSNHTNSVVATSGMLPVPSNLVALIAPAGQKRLMATAYKQAYWPLAQYFETQKNTAYCSVASSVMVLNALEIKRPKTEVYPGYPYFTQDDFFYAIDPRLADPAKVAEAGMTLDQLSAVLSRFPVTVHKYHASDLTLAQFRDLIRDSVSHLNRFVLLNFDREQIHEVGEGHWSPLAAYDPVSDSALVLDVARYKYPAVWVPVAQLYAAAQAVDGASGLARGIVVIGKS